MTQPRPPQRLMPNPAPRAARPAGVVDRVQRLLGVGLLVIVAVNVANALGRHVFGLSLQGTDEVMVFTMIWIVMIGAVVSLALRAHISIDLVAGRVRGRRLAALFLLHDLAALVGCAYVTKASWQFLSRIAPLGTTSMGLGIPMTVPHGALLLGFGAMTLVAGVMALRSAGQVLAGRPALPQAPANPQAAEVPR